MRNQFRFHFKKEMLETNMSGGLNEIESSYLFFIKKRMICNITKTSRVHAAAIFHILSFLFSVCVFFFRHRGSLIKFTPHCYPHIIYEINSAKMFRMSIEYGVSISTAISLQLFLIPAEATTIAHTKNFFN